MSSPSSWIELGTIARAHGVRGWVRVHLADPSSTALEELDEIALGEPGRMRKLDAVEGDAGGYRLLLDGVRDRDAADALRGQTIWARREDLPSLEEDQLYVADLVGAAVLDVAGARIGEVQDVVHYGAHETLVIARSDGSEVMVPFVDGIVVEVDVAGRRVVVDPPEGLLEINQPEKGTKP